MSIREKTPLLDIDAILLELKQDKKVYLALVDIASGKETWRFELVGRKTGVGLGALKQSIVSFLDAVPVTDAEGNILFPDDKMVSRIDAKTGKILWTNENEKSVGRLNFSDDGKTVYIGAGKKIKALSLADGKETWKDPLKINGEFQTFIPGKKANEMFVVTKSEITLIDDATGKAIWKKPAPFASLFITLRETEKGFLVLSGDDKTSSFDYIDFDGKNIWKRPYRTDKPVVNFQMTPKGILFANAEEANMIDLQTGDDSIWKKRIKLKGSPVLYRDDKIALIYSDEKLYRVNMETLAFELLAEDIKFKGSDEDVENIELLSNGYLLSSSQNMWLITPDGKVGYSVYNKPASAGTALKVSGAVGKVYNTLSSIEVTQDPSSPGTNNIHRSEAGNERAAMISNVIANRKKTFGTQTAVYMLTRIEDGATKRVGMVKINKETGKEEDRIALKVLDPKYEVDYVTGKLYLITNDAGVGSELSCFSL